MSDFQAISDAMRCDAVRCDAMRCGAVRCDAMRCDARSFVCFMINKTKISSMMTTKTSGPPSSFAVYSPA